MEFKKNASKKPKLFAYQNQTWLMVLSSSHLFFHVRAFPKIKAQQKPFYLYCLLFLFFVVVHEPSVLAFTFTAQMLGVCV